jgi:hypothetical protein
MKKRFYTLAFYLQRMSFETSRIQNFKKCFAGWLDKPCISVMGKEERYMF